MNVIVVVCNSVHLGFLGAYGNAWIETPNLDRLAAEGIVFEHHFPENLTTLPTRRSWWTGRYGFAEAELGWTPLGPEEAILPDLLWDQGVRTALISDVPLLREVGLGYGRGFDEVIWIRGQGYDPLVPLRDPRAKHVRLDDEPGLRLPPEDDPDYALWKKRWEQLLRNRAVLETDREENTGVARTVNAAIDWLERRGGGVGPVPALAGHLQPARAVGYSPALPRPVRDGRARRIRGWRRGRPCRGGSGRTTRRSTSRTWRRSIDVPAGAVGDVLSEAELFRLRRTYAGSMTLVDTWLGKLFEALRRMGRMDDTLVVFTSDQGEPLGEHGFVRRFRPWLYEELIHTPLIIRLPKGQRGGIRHQALVQTVDLLPTIVSALGLPPLDLGETPPHGHDLLPLIRGEQTKVRDYACMGMDVAEFAIRTHLWHLIVPVENDPEEPRSAELFRKPEDRWDQNNVIDQHPEVAEHLELALRRFVAALESGRLEDLPVPPRHRPVRLRLNGPKVPR